MASDRLHRLCNASLLLDKRIGFAAILDSCGKIIVGKCNNEKDHGFIFYRDSLLPAITNMNTYRSNGSNHNVYTKTQLDVFDVGISTKIFIAKIRGIDIGIENENRRYFLVAYWKDDLVTLLRRFFLYRYVSPCVSPSYSLG